MVSHLPVLDRDVIRGLSGTRLDSVDEADRPWASWFAVSPGFFAAIDITVVSGRGFEIGDAMASQPVAIVSELAAERFFEG